MHIALLVRLPPDPERMILTFAIDELSSKKRFSEAARVLLDYACDDNQAVIALVQGNEFSEARRIVRLPRNCGRRALTYLCIDVPARDSTVTRRCGRAWNAGDEGTTQRRPS